MNSVKIKTNAGREGLPSDISPILSMKQVLKALIQIHLDLLFVIFVAISVLFFTENDFFEWTNISINSHCNIEDCINYNNVYANVAIVSIFLLVLPLIILTLQKKNKNYVGIIFVFFLPLLRISPLITIILSFMFICGYYLDYKLIIRTQFSLAIISALLNALLLSTMMYLLIKDIFLTYNVLAAYILIMILYILIVMLVNYIKKD